MKNKLTFTGNALINEWDKYNAIVNYRWNKHQLINTPLYGWEKWSTKDDSELTYYWKKYPTILSTAYYSFTKDTIQHQTLFKWKKYSINSTTTSEIYADPQTMDEYQLQGQTQITLYDEPKTTSHSTTFYYGEDYWYSKEDIIGYIFHNNKWLYVTEIWNYGSGTAFTGQDVTIREETIETKGDFIEDVTSLTQNAYPTNDKQNGYWYVSQQSSSTNYYNGTVTKVNLEGVHKCSQVPVLDKFTGKYTFVDDDNARIPYYSYNDVNDAFYYIVTGEDDNLRVNVQSFISGTVYSYGEYIGLSALNGSYMQLEYKASRIKVDGTYEMVSSNNPNEYPQNGIADDDYWYEFDHDSAVSGYAWKKYQLNHTQDTTYVWNVYKPKYSWKRYAYSTVETPDINGKSSRLCSMASGHNPYPTYYIRLNSSSGTILAKLNCSYSQGTSRKSGINNEYDIFHQTTQIIDFDSPVTGKLYLTSSDAEYNDITPINVTNLKQLKLLYGEEYISEVGFYVYNFFYYYTPANTKGAYHDTVYSENPNAYTDGQIINNYWYEFYQREQGAYHSQVTSHNSDEYQSGWSGTYYYESMPSTVVDEYTKGEYIEDVVSNDRNAYPDNGMQGNYWYEYKGLITSRTKDEFIDYVYNTDKSLYPDDGIDTDNYWYIFISETDQFSKGDLIGTVESLNRDTYPDDYYDDSDYWYVYDNIFYTKGNTTEGKIQDYNRNAYPDNGEQGGYWFVYSGKKPINIAELTDADLYGGVNVSQQTNTIGDIMFGMVAGSQISFTVDNSLGQTADYLNARIDHYVQFNDEDDFKKIGTYNVAKVKRYKNKADVIAYDICAKLDKDIKSFLSSPRNDTLYNWVKALCDYCDISLIWKDELTANKSLMISSSKITDKNITGRQLMTWLCELAGAFCVSNENADLIVGGYRTTSISIDNTKYCNLQISDFAVPKIDQLIDGNTGNKSGSGSNWYVINNNPFVTQSSLSGLYTKLHAIPEYYPCSFNTFNDYDIMVGDIITIDGQKTIIMSKNISQSGVVFESYGNEKRTNTFDPTTIKINEAKSLANMAQISADNAQSTANSASQTANQASIEVGLLETQITGKVSFTDLERAGQTTINGANITTGTIDANRINLNGLYGGTIQPVGTAYTQGVKMHVSDVRGDTDVICQQGTAMLRVDSNYVSIDRTGIILSFGGHNLTITSAGVKVDGRAI